MRNVWKHGAALLRRLIWLGMGLQVLLGLFWMLNNMGIEHSFGVDWSSGGPHNRPFMQWGPLYPFAVRTIRGMAQWLHIPYYCIMYCLQLAAALGSGWFLLKSVTRWKWYGCLGGAVVLLSVPMAMQSHLALLPYSFLGSVVVCQLGFVILLWKQEKWSVRSLMPVYLCWLLELLLLPEYLWFGAIPLVLTAVVAVWRHRRKWAAGALTGILVLGSVLCILTVGTAWRQREEGQLSMRQMLAARCTWSNLYELSGVWSPELLEQVEWTTLRAACDNPEVFYEGFFDKLAQLPEEQQKTYLHQMIGSARDVNGKRMLLEIAYDAVGYLMPGAVIPKQLEGEGFVSLTGMNYWHFTRSQMGWSSLGLEWYCIWSWLSVLAVLLVKLAEILGSGKAEARTSLGEAGKLLIPGLLMAMAGMVFYTISRIGVYDYKILSWWTILWCAGTLILIEEKKKKEE